MHVVTVSCVVPQSALQPCQGESSVGDGSLRLVTHCVWHCCVVPTVQVRMGCCRGVPVTGGWHWCTTTTTAETTTAATDPAAAFKTQLGFASFNAALCKP